jgi:hypothetical protein
LLLFFSIISMGIVDFVTIKNLWLNLLKRCLHWPRLVQQCQ